MSNNILNTNKLFPININCITGQVTIGIHYNTILWPNGQIPNQTNTENLADPKLICYLSSLRHGNTEQQKESAGDMIVFNNLIFNQQNHFNEKTNTIDAWSKQDPSSCYKLQYDGDIPLQDFKLQYKNLYL